jgi:hypothetical protein
MCHIDQVAGQKLMLRKRFTVTKHTEFVIGATIDKVKRNLWKSALSERPKVVKIDWGGHE